MRQAWVLIVLLLAAASIAPAQQKAAIHRREREGFRMRSDFSLESRALMAGRSGESRVGTEKIGHGGLRDVHRALRIRLKRPHLTFKVLLLLLIVPRALLAQQAGPEDEVRAAYSAFSRAYVQADVSVLERLLTEDYVHVNGRSGDLLSRSQWLKWVATRRAALDSGELVIATYDVEEVKVQLYGDAAVLTGTVTSSGLSSGAPFTSRVRFTNVWVKQGGQWRRAAFHDSPAGE